ncbi:MAG: CaiB/BaiF CoA transferase family protein [Acidimicrobiia bacterium]
MATESFLSDVRVLEVADEKAEYCGKLLAGAGADVVKIEPPGGSPTRRIGPFVDDIEDPEKSLHFWHYDFGKRSVTLDLTTTEGQAAFRRLAADADVVLESQGPGVLDGLGLGYDQLSSLNPGLIMASITPFGQSGPYRDWQGSDLVHLAMGGVMMSSGYDPTPEGEYDIEPIAPQMWHSNHIVGMQMTDAILAALLYRSRTGRGQFLDGSIHRSVSLHTGSDLPMWIFSRQTVKRQTGRYGTNRIGPESLAPTKDGRHVLAFVSAEFQIGREHKKWIEMLDTHGSADDLTDPKYDDLEYVLQPTNIRHVHAVARRWIAGYKFDRDIWREGQNRRLHWAPVRKPEDNLSDPHWAQRATFAEVAHPEIGRSVRYPVAPWLAESCPWRTDRKAPKLGEHNDDVFSAVTTRERTAPEPVPTGPEPPFPLDGVRILDLSWVVAGAGGTRILSGLGAEVLRLEWKGRHDAMRTMGGIPAGEERERLLRGEPITVTRTGNVNFGSTFSEVNPGKRSFGLNMKTAKGLELFHELVKISDVVVENFTAHRLAEFGATYDTMRAVNPEIIYVQQPGFGKKGLYSDFLSSAPVAEAFSGLTEMAGMPSPYPPSGWGYFFLDWSAAYYCAMAVMSALYYKQRTGKGQYIDGSLGEPGLNLTGTAMVDYQVNGRSWERIGNTSPYKKAVVHGVFRCQGDDRWIAITAFTREQFAALCSVLDLSATVEGTALDRRAAAALDADVRAATAAWDPFALMERLQAAGVPAGVCQTAQDRIERDPQLAHDQFLVPVTSTEAGTWPTRQFPIKLSETPSRPGGRPDRGFPCYAEDNDYVFGELLGLSAAEQAALAAADVI